MIQNENGNIKQPRGIFSGVFSNIKRGWGDFIIALAFSLKREHYPSDISEHTKRRVNIMLKSKLIDQNIKNQILARVKTLSLKLSYKNFSLWRIHVIQLATNRIIKVIFIIYISVIAFQTQKLNLNYLDFVKQILEFVFVIVILLILNHLLNIVEEKFSEQIRLVIMTFVFLFSFGVLYYIRTYPELINLFFAIYLVAMFFRCILGILILSFISILSFKITTHRYFYRNLADAIVVAHILSLLDSLEKKPNILTDLDFKVTGMNRLDYMADPIEKIIPAKLRTRNSEFNKWITLVTQRISNSVRDKKKWILTPKEDTAKYLTDYLVHFLSHFVRGDWDELEQLDSPTLSRMGWWNKLFLSSIKIVIPIVALGFFFWWLLTSKFSNEPWIIPLIVSLTVPVIGYILGLLDPSAKEKIESFNEVAGWF